MEKFILNKIYLEDLKINKKENEPLIIIYNKKAIIIKVISKHP